MRLTCGHQTLEVAQDGAGLCTRLLIQLDERLQLLAGLGVAGGCQAEVGATVQHALCDFLEGVQVLAQQEHRLGAHALRRLELVSRLADTLGQHHQLACGRNLGGGRILLKFQGRDRLRDLQQVRGLAVDGTQSVAHLRQDLLLTHHHARVALGTLHQRRDGIQFGAERLAQCLHIQFVVAPVECAHVARQHARALHHVGEGLGAAHQGLRHGLRKPLRLHQRLAGRRQLLRRAVGLLQNPADNQGEHHQSNTQQHQQAALVDGSGCAAQQRQRDQVFIRKLPFGILRRIAGIALHAGHAIGLVRIGKQSARRVLRQVSGVQLSIRVGGLAVKQFSKWIDDGHGAALQK